MTTNGNIYFISFLSVVTIFSRPIKRQTYKMKSSSFHLQFRLQSPAAVSRLSVFQLPVDRLDDFDTLVEDARMGPHNISTSEECPTCGLTASAGCHGHYGSFDLAVPILNTMFHRFASAIARFFCYACGKFISPSTDDVKVPFDMRKYASIPNADLDRWRVKQRVCPHCGHAMHILRVHVITKADAYLSYGFLKASAPGAAAQPLDMQAIYSLFNTLTAADCASLGLDAVTTHPAWIFMTKFLVAPPRRRPAMVESVEFSRKGNGDGLMNYAQFEQFLRQCGDKSGKKNVLTNQLKLVYSCNAALFEKLAVVPPASANVLAIAKRNLQTAVYNMLYRTSANSPGVMLRLKGKDGRFQNNVYAKRIHCNARLVLGPDPHIRIDELGVPAYVARTLFIQDFVSPHNIDSLQRQVSAMALKSVARAGKEYTMYSPDMVLRVGDEVLRPLKNGDYVLFGRQPTLHEGSIVCLQVHILSSGGQFRINQVLCPPLNADFDGDACTMYCVIAYEARVVAHELMGVHTILLSSSTGQLAIGLRDSYALQAWRLTDAPTFDSLFGGSIPIGMFCDCVCGIAKIPNWCLAAIRARKESSDAPPLTGCMLLSVALPPTLSWDGPITEVAWRQTDADPRFRERPRVRRGRWVSGEMTATVSKALIRDIALHPHMGAGIALETLQDLNNIIMETLYRKPPCLRMSEFMPKQDEMRDLKHVVASGCSDVIPLAPTMHRMGSVVGGSMTPQKRKKIMAREEQRTAQLTEIRFDSSRAIQHRVYNDASNIITQLLKSGSKMTTMCFAQTFGIVGQLFLHQQRIPNHCSRIMPLARNVRDVHIMEAVSRGFIADTFFQGLGLLSFIQLLTATREALIATAKKTSGPGYADKQLQQMTSRLSVEHDRALYVARQADDGNFRLVKLQDRYGTHGYDTCKSCMAKEGCIPFDFRKYPGLVQELARGEEDDEDDIGAIQIAQPPDWLCQDVRDDQLSAAFAEHSRACARLCLFTEGQWDLLRRRVSQYHWKGQIQQEKAIGAITSYAITQRLMQGVLNSKNTGGSCAKTIQSTAARLNECAYATKDIERRITEATKRFSSMQQMSEQFPLFVQRHLFQFFSDGSILLMGIDSEGVVSKFHVDDEGGNVNDCDLVVAKLSFDIEYCTLFAVSPIALKRAVDETMRRSGILDIQTKIIVRSAACIDFLFVSDTSSDAKSTVVAIGRRRHPLLWAKCGQFPDLHAVECEIVPTDDEAVLLKVKLYRSKTEWNNRRVTQLKIFANDANDGVERCFLERLTVGQFRKRNAVSQRQTRNKRKKGKKTAISRRIAESDGESIDMEESSSESEDSCPNLRIVKFRLPTGLFWAGDNECYSRRQWNTVFNSPVIEHDNRSFLPKKRSRRAITRVDTGSDSECPSSPTAGVTAHRHLRIQLRPTIAGSVEWRAAANRWLLTWKRVSTQLLAMVRSFVQLQVPRKSVLTLLESLATDPNHYIESSTNSTQHNVVPDSRWFFAVLLEQWAKHGRAADVYDKVLRHHPTFAGFFGSAAVHRLLWEDFLQPVNEATAIAALEHFVEHWPPQRTEVTDGGITILFTTAAPAFLRSPAFWDVYAHACSCDVPSQAVGKLLDVHGNIGLTLEVLLPCGPPSRRSAWSAAAVAHDMVTLEMSDDAQQAEFGLLSNVQSIDCRDNGRQYIVKFNKDKLRSKAMEWGRLYYAPLHAAGWTDIYTNSVVDMTETFGAEIGSASLRRELKETFDGSMPMQHIETLVACMMNSGVYTSITSTALHPYRQGANSTLAMLCYERILGLLPLHVVMGRPDMLQGTIETTAATSFPPVGTACVEMCMPCNWGVCPAKQQSPSADVPMVDISTMRNARAQREKQLSKQTEDELGVSRFCMDRLVRTVEKNVTTKERRRKKTTKGKHSKSIDVYSTIKQRKSRVERRGVQTHRVRVSCMENFSHMFV